MAAKKASGGSEDYLLTEDEKEEVTKTVKDGDCAPLQKLIKNKWNLNQPLYGDDHTALHLAAGRGRTEVVRVLVQGGADVNVRDKDGWTPLHRAAGGGQTNTVKELLANKASVDVRTEMGWTPLYWAALCGHTDTVKVLLANKASVDVRDESGWTPLHRAAERGHTDTVKVLLANKASVDVRDRWGDTPLHAAAEYGRTEVVKLLCRESECDVHTVNKIGDTPLHRACKCGHLDVVKLLVEEDGDVTVVNKNGETAYDVCGRKGNVDESTVESMKKFLKEHLFRLEFDAPPTDPRGIADIHKLIPTISFDGSHAVYLRKSDQKVATTADPRGIADIHKLIPTICFDGSHAVYRRKYDQKVATTADPRGIADIDRQISTISLDRSHAFYRQKSDQKVATTAEPDVSGDIERQISDIYDDADEFEYSYRRGQKQGTMAGLKIDAGSSVQFPSGKVTEKEASKSRTSNTEYKFDRHRRHDLSEKANATIDGATGGVILWKEVQLRVPPNAISGHIKIEFVDQPLLARTVHDKTKGRANLHRQGICVTCTDKNAILSDPAEIRVTLRTMLEKASDQQLNSEDFRILREKDGDLTDVTEECNVKLHGEEVIFYLKTFSGLNFARVADFASSIVTSVTSVFTTIKSLFKTSYMCKICPYIIGGQDEGLIVKLYCHGEQVECSGGFEHECIYDSEKHRFPNEVTLWFEIECRCIENGNETTVPSTKDFKLYRSVCESTGKPFSKVMPGVKALVPGWVQLYLYALNYPDKLLDISVAVHEVSAVGKAPATRTKSNTTGIGTCAEELHRQLLLLVADSVVKEDFGRLKGLCKAWIKPALAEKITKTEELLEELEKQEIIKIGEYSKLMEMLGKLKLNVVKSCVDKLSRRIKALGTDVSPSLT